MKTEKDIEKTKKGFDTVKTFREIKDRISADLYGKSNEQIKEYLQKSTNPNFSDFLPKQAYLFL